MKRSYCLILIILGLSIIPNFIWFSTVLPDLKNNSQNFEMFFETTAVLDAADFVGDELETRMAIHTFELNVSDTNANVMDLSGKYSVNDIIDDQIIFERNEFYQVDKFTKISKEHDLMIYFPNNIQKKSYTMLFPFLGRIADFTFESKEFRDDLLVYNFSCVSNFNSTGLFPLFQDHNMFTFGTCQVMIEPTTGYLINMDTQFQSYAYVDGEEIQVTSGNIRGSTYSKIIHTQSAKDLKTSLFLYDTIIPIFYNLIIFSLFLVILFRYQLQSKSNELSLEKQEKLSLLGELSARLAHDLRHPLSVIQVSVENLKLQIDQDPSKFSQFEKIHRAIDRMTHQVDDVLGFVRGIPLYFHKCDLSKIIKESIDSISIPKDIEIILPKNNVVIDCDGKQILIVLNNLILNAIQAIHEKGSIKISLEDNDTTVILEIEDSGMGINQEKFNKIFNPLYTTKMQGTGLGLASVKSIIDAHKGKISVTSPPTVFRIILPKISKKY